MSRRRLPPVLLATACLLLAACSSDEVVDADGQRLTRLEHMQLYCQTKPCDCVDAEAGLFLQRDPVEPTWRVTGEPECPTGYRLEPASE